MSIIFLDTSFSSGFFNYFSFSVKVFFLFSCLINFFNFYVYFLAESRYPLCCFVLLTRYWGNRGPGVTPVAGPIFEAKIERYFLESFFRERNYCPRTAFSGSSSRSILSNQVISWNGSRADRCPLGGEITAKMCSLLGNEGTPPDFERLFLEKRSWKRFSTNVLIRGDMNPLHSQWMGTRL